MPDPTYKRIVWDKDGERLYETGVDHVVLFVKNSAYDPDTPGSKAYLPGVAWNGVTAINERPSGGEASPLWADNMKYLNLRANEDFGLTLEAYTYPDEFAECDGSTFAGSTGVKLGQQPRKPFGLCYRTKIGNDVEGVQHGYKLHLVYGCDAAPSEKSHQTINDSPEAITFSWEFSTTPAIVSGFQAVAHIEIDSTKFTASQMKAIEDKLYGVDTTTGTDANAGAESYLPLPDEVLSTMGYVAA